MTIQNNYWNFSIQEQKIADYILRYSYELKKYISIRLFPKKQIFLNAISSTFSLIIGIHTIITLMTYLLDIVLFYLGQRLTHISFLEKEDENT